MEKGWWRGRATGKTLHGKPRGGMGGGKFDKLRIDMENATMIQFSS